MIISNRLLSLVVTTYKELLQKLQTFAPTTSKEEFIHVSRTELSKLEQMNLRKVAVTDSVRTSTMARIIRDKQQALVSLMAPSFGSGAVVGRKYQLLSSIFESQIKVLGFPTGWTESKYALEFFLPSLKAQIAKEHEGYYRLDSEDSQKTVELMREIFPELELKRDKITDEQMALFVVLGHQASHMEAAITKAQAELQSLIISLSWDDHWNLIPLNPNLSFIYLPRQTYLRFIGQRLMHQLMLQFPDTQFTMYAD